MKEKELEEFKKYVKDTGYDDELKDIYLREVLDQEKIRMRSNFRPNIRLAINIFLVVGTFTIALKIAPIAVMYQGKIYVLNI